MGQLGSGNGSSYPNAIDSRQTFRNSSTAAPDSDTRIDSEYANDSLAAIIALETTLGANVNGVFGSLAARLNMAFPGSGGVPGIITFSNALTVNIPGSQHNVGQAALLWQLYDNQIPAHAIEPGLAQMRVSPETYDVALDFAIPLSGSIALGVQAPLHIAQFVNTDTVSVPGNVHQLPSADIVFQVYFDDGSGLLTATEPGAFTVDATSYDVRMTFIGQYSGWLVMSAGGPAYATSFTNVDTLTIPGGTHLLGTSALIFQTYDTATPRNALGDPDVSINPTTFDIVVQFGVPMSGRIVFGAVSTLTGRDFDIRDGGVINQSAVRMHSQLGTLLLQPGAGDLLQVLNKTGQAVLTFNTALQRLGLGTTTPAHALELVVDDAVKPGGGSWHAPSDDRLKEDLETMAEGLDVVLHLEPVRYRYNGLGGLRRTGQEYIGLSAQAVRVVAPALVRTYRGQLQEGEPLVDLLALDPSPLVYYLINAVKALHALLLEGRQRQSSLEQQVSAIAGRLAALEPPEEVST